MATSLNLGFIGLGIMGAPWPATCAPPATRCSCTTSIRPRPRWWTRA